MIVFLYCTATLIFFYFVIFEAFAKMFNSTPDDLDMHLIYDVSHNIAKMEEHLVEGKRKRLLVHRKGSTRAFPPHHPLIPVDYQGQNFTIKEKAPILFFLLQSYVFRNQHLHINHKK